MVAQGSRTLKLSILADVDNLRKSLKAGEADVSGFTGKLQGFSDQITTAFKVATAAAVVFAGKIAIDSIKAASDLGETVSKVGVLFGDSANEIKKFAEGAAQSLGQTQQQALDAAANFAIFGKSAGLSGQALVNFSTDFVSLAADLASFNNVSQDEAINAIGSALRGEAEPLRKFGVLLDDATLKSAALELGLISNTKNALTPQQKVLAAQKVIYEQTTAAQGDFARTSDGLANQTKILTAELENTKLIIGEALLPIVLQLATVFSKQIIPLIKQFAYGLSGKEGLDESLSESEQSAKLWGQRINGLIKIVVDFKDELIILAGVIGAVFVVSKIAAGVAATIAAIKTLVNAYNALKASAIVAGVATAFALNPLLGVGAVALAAAVLSGANALANRSDIDVDFDSSKFATSGAPGAISGFGTTTGTRQGPTDESIARFAPAGADRDAAIARIAAKAGGAATDSQNAARFAGAGGITDAQNAARLAAEALAANEAANASRVAAAAAAAAAAVATPSITINVSGAVDKEGTARTIVNTVNDAFFRGTGGATALVGV